jgi:hypothetical protein
MDEHRIPKRLLEMVMSRRKPRNAGMSRYNWRLLFKRQSTSMEPT